LLGRGRDAVVCRVTPLWPDVSSDELRVRIGANIRAARLRSVRLLVPVKVGSRTLLAGELGTVVKMRKGGEEFTVEFFGPPRCTAVVPSSDLASMTQQELADAAGISRVHISYIESGKFGGIETIHAIAQVLDADWRKLLADPKPAKK